MRVVTRLCSLLSSGLDMPGFGEKLQDCPHSICHVMQTLQNKWNAGQHLNFEAVARGQRQGACTA